MFLPKPFAGLGMGGRQDKTHTVEESQRLIRALPNEGLGSPDSALNMSLSKIFQKAKL